MHPTLRRSLAPIVFAALLAASCSGSSSVESQPDDTSPPTTAEPTTTPPTTAPPSTAPPTTASPVTEPPASTEPPETTAPPTDPGTFGDGFGPYPVGVTTLTIADVSGGDRDLTVDVWFPLARDATGLEPHRYTLLPGTYYESPQAFTAAPEQIAADGPFPLVVYSHGSGALRFIHSNYTEAIASNGYVVVAPDHTGNTVFERLAGTDTDGAANALARPRDVTAVIDAFLNPESQETVGFVAGIDPGRIAVTGHSFGGFTAYAMASGFANEAGEFVADERVGAIIALAPAAGEQLLADELLASIEVPSLVIAGTDDVTTPIDPNVTRPWELTASSPAYRVDLIAAEHQTFTDICAYQASVPTLADVPDIVVETIDEFAVEGCSEGDMPIERAQALTNTFAVTFLDSVFRGEAPIDPAAVADEPDLIYLTK